MIQLKIKYNSTRTKIYACCPYCQNIGKTPDTKFHMIVTVGKACYCFRCGHKSPYEELRQQYVFDVSNLASLQDTQPTPDDFDKLLAKNVIAFNESMYSVGAMGYLHNRGISDVLIDKMSIRLGTADLFGRVVFVDFLNKYYVARAFLPNVSPKTLNPQAAMKPFMYLHEAVYKTLYIVEGTFDAIPFIKTGRSVVCLLGKDISPSQIRQLRRVEVGNIILALDADAVGGSIHLVPKITLIKPMSNVGILMYDNHSKKDPGEYDIELFNNTQVAWHRVIDSEIIDVL